METNHKRNSSRIGLSGDIPTRALSVFLRSTPVLPAWIEISIVSLFSAVFYLLATSQRRGIQHNLRAIYQDLGSLEAFGRGYCVFCHFAFTYVDSQRAKLHQDVIKWEIKGMHHFESLQKKGSPALIFTTHTGNYDLAAKLFAQKFTRPLHTVRLPEKNRHMQKLRAEDFQSPQNEESMLKVLFNTNKNLLGIQLINILKENGLVAIQCDRVMQDVAPISLPFNEGYQIKIPKGPLTLASVAKCPCYPLFVIRQGFRHYQIMIEAPLKVVLPEGQRKIKEADIGNAWVQRLKVFLQEHAEQWFVLEKHFHKN